LIREKKFNEMTFTFPANGILKGSVQKIPRRANAIRDVLTAIESSIGSSGGITEVIINEQLNKSLYLLLVGSSNPYRTCKKQNINKQETGRMNVINYLCCTGVATYTHPIGCGCRYGHHIRHGNFQVFRISLHILYKGEASLSILKPKEDLLGRSSVFGLYTHLAVSLTISF
jgi:hypothetical protein